ncbi:thiamine-phosphate kinase [Granulicella sp. dw_53]|uniref:thiamine-phosphate kinase n=1 Tax=Granulicella sp. dw_53 TaxID=2719792 RepID=UPI001BD1C3F0|nr:thiamine-phosphate kinase [Granulicella sp. dw_53]
MKKKQKQPGELALIEQIRRGETARGRGIVLGIGDDCAILRPAVGSEVLVTTDFTLEGRHFRRDLHPAESVGHRCLARGLSDLAAMGAAPLAAFLSLALPREMLATPKGRGWVEGFFGGWRGLGRRYGVPLAGGDTAESPNGLVLADIVLVGTAPAGTALRRSGGRAGDALYCTGRLGGAAAELEGLFARGRMARVTDVEEHPQLFPEPRLRVAEALRRRGLARACLDLSDGLSTDLAHLCAESGVHAEVEEAWLPLHPLTARMGEARALELALHGGEDYELLFSADASVRVPRRIAGVAVTRIGRLTRRRRGEAVVTLVRGDGRREALPAGGWEHFAGSA